MMLVEETSVPLAALPIAQFKSHLRLGTGFADDAVQDTVLESFLRAAIAAVEARTGKVLIERDFSWSLTAWRTADAQALPVAPVRSVISVVSKGPFGEETIAPSDTHFLRDDPHRPVLCSTTSALPTVPKFGEVEVTFVAGYGSNWDDVPPDLAHAVLLLAAHYYQYRAETGLGGLEGRPPPGRHWARFGQK